MPQRFFRVPPPFSSFYKLLSCAFLLGILAASSFAQEVEVSAVKFANVRPAYDNSANWLEADITLNVHPAQGAPGQMVPRVRVELLLGCEVPTPAGGERRTEYYKAVAECVALEAGRADVRFYLPPEIVKRDQVHSDPKFWSVDVTAGGRPQNPSHAGSSPALASGEARRTFQSRAVSAAVSNDGVLVPQYLTPFDLQYPHPSFVRHEPR